MSTGTSPTRSFEVKGMTCGHCRSSVIEEIAAVEGVEAVEVDLETGRADVRGDFDDDRIREAVEEAGYELGDSR